MAVKEHITCYRELTPSEWRNRIDLAHKDNTQAAAWCASILWWDFSDSRDSQDTPGVGEAFDDLCWKYSNDEAKDLLGEDSIRYLEAIGYAQARARCSIKQDEWKTPVRRAAH